MSVADDVTRRVDLLGSRIVVRLSIYKVPGVEMVDRHLNVESGVGLEILTVHRAHKLGRRHVRGRGNDTHRSGVTRTSLDLLAICQRQIPNGETEVDKVVGRGERGNLSSRRCFLTVTRKPFGNDGGIEG